MTDLPDSESIRVLLIEDDPDYAKLIQRDLSSSRTSSFDTAHVSLLERGLELLAGASFDVGILDLNLPDSTGVDTVARVHAAAPDMAIVVLSASDETAVIQDVLLEGAQEFITKQPTAENLLVRSIRYAIDRLKAEKKQIRMIKGLKAVVDAAAELIQCPDVDTTLRRSVELAREKLGIERCAIFLDAGNNRVRGTYGTNCLGETTDERSYDAEMAAACEKQPLDQRPQGALWFASECAHTDWNGKEPVPIGKGWVVDSPILSSTGKPIASFTNDTAISGSPIDPVTQNILAVYCSHLGPLIESKRAEEARRESEQQLLQAQKMEAVGRLAGGIAHDFNNLLMIILNNASFVKDTLPSNSSAYADINEVVAAGRRASDLTQQLLAYSSRQMLARKVVDLNSVLTGTEHMLKRIIGEDIELTFVPTEDEAIVEVDSGQIEQVLLNLVVNARDAMPDGGRIVVQIENVSLFPEDVHHFVAATGKPEGEYVVFSVSDTGAGMSEVEREQIFEPFFTTKSVDKGTGLGLSMALGIVKQHNGYMSVYSHVDIGTTFKVYLPRKHAEVGTAGTALTRADLPRGSETILLAEDDPSVRRIAVRMLEFLGYSVLAAEDAEEAMKVAQEYGSVIHLLLTDLIMPGMNGKALAGKVTELRPEMRIIFASGYPELHLTKMGLIENGTTLLRKPFDTLEVARTIRRILEDKTDD